jgi:alkylated DNA repair dioxygenase AlkB
MQTLFAAIGHTQAVPDIPGLSYHPNYIDARQESELVAAIEREPWDTTWKRRRQAYGAAYGKQVAITRAIPQWAQFLVDRLYRERISDRRFDQMLVNEYFPGLGISLHRDYDPFDRTVVSLSLLSVCVMDFRHASSNRKESLLLERRSLLVLRDEARYDWEHGIAPRKSDRWNASIVPRERRLSVTFRLLKHSPFNRSKH